MLIQRIHTERQRHRLRRKRQTDVMGIRAGRRERVCVTKHGKSHGHRRERERYGEREIERVSDTEKVI